MVNRWMTSRLFSGIVGGVIAGAVVALWFFAVDLVSIQPFRTPSVLAGAVLGEVTAVTTIRLVLAYTVLHFGVFAALGAVTAWLMSVTRVAPSLFAGAVFGIGILNGAHYGGLLITGLDLLTVLPVGHVLGANVVGGMVMMAYLHRTWHVEAPMGIGAMVRHPLAIEGVTTGLLSAVVVALWFFIIDVAAGTPLFTPAALGSAVFLGASTPAGVEHSVGMALAYTVLHVAAFGIVGTAFAWVAGRLERTPAFWLLPLLAFIVLDALFVGAIGLRAEWVLGALGWWAILVGNLLAAIAMGGYLWRRHPHMVIYP